MRSRYQPNEAARALERYAQHGPELGLRVYTSRLLGQDPSLVLHGGGNTSVKISASELTGEKVEALYVKGSGWDLASIEPAGFPACRLDALRRMCQLPSLSDDDMVKGLRGQMLDPKSPTPSVEALLHAYLPARYVDHTHADAVLALVDQPDGEARAREVWGERMLFVPYCMPGFVLLRRIVELGSSLDGAELMVLDKHGIFTWGPDARESYERMISEVDRAEQFVAKARASVSVPPAPEVPSAEQRAQLLPVVRGALARAEDGQRLIVALRSDPEILGLLARPDAAELTRIGTMTPDHVIRIKPLPAFLQLPAQPAEWRSAIESVLADYARYYERYFERHSATNSAPLTRLDRLPRVILVPGWGALCLGKTRQDADIAGDIMAHTAAVISDAQAVGSYRPVSEAELFEVEYWSLEQAKLGVGKSADGPLARRIALVTGAARGIGRATLERLLEVGAHAYAADRDAAALEATLGELRSRFGPRIAAAPCDVTDPAAVERLLSAVVNAFGGIDVVVSNAGSAPSGLLHTESGAAALDESLRINLLSHQYVAAAASRVMIAQGAGGVLLFNASKSAFNQGPEFGPYAVPKAALVSLMKQYAVDLGKYGVRANAVNADRIHTNLFGGGVLEARAKARGLSPEAYFRQNLLGRETTARDVAEAFVYLASAEATTGAVLSVDGGNPAAFPR